MWKNYFNNLTPITDKYKQIFFGDYSYLEYNYLFKKELIEYIEVKGDEDFGPIDTDKIFIETWSRRNDSLYANKSEGWIYKQLRTKYFIFINNNHEYIIDYLKLKNIWFSLYPNPKIFNDYKTMNYINNKYVNNDYEWYYSRTKCSNKSEGYYIPEKWFYKNNLIILKI